MVDLQAVIEDLARYCQECGVENPSISIVLPKLAQDTYTAEFTPGEKTRIVDTKKAGAMRRLFVTNGVCNIYNNDEDVVVKKQDVGGTY